MASPGETPMVVKMVAASDHAGLGLRAEAIKAARAHGVEVEDLGPFTAESVDYPDLAVRVGEALAAGRAAFGLLVCGTGIGMSIAANKLPGVRAALCRSEFEARMARAHNDANVLCLGERVTGVGLGTAIVEAFLATPFEGGRHARRVEKLVALDR
jgi:ribose 5-phosphate isomerase B